MKTLGFQAKINRIIALCLMGYFSIFSPAAALAITQPVSAPITVPVPIPAPTSTPTPSPIPVPTAPEMVYPQNGQTLDLEGGYMFKVKPVAGASGYLFGFFQNGVMIWENLRDTGRLNPNGEFAIWPNDPAHAKFQPGPVKVMIRAMVNNRWSDAREIVIYLKPRVPITNTKPDLTVSVTATSIQPAIPSYYATMKLTILVRNIGSASAQPSVLQIIMSQSSRGISYEEASWKLWTTALAPGASQVLTITTPYQFAGTYQFLVKADADGRVSESNENNNSTTTVVVIPLLSYSIKRRAPAPTINSIWPANLRLGRR